MATITKEQVDQIVKDATAAANAAGERWLSAATVKYSIHEVDLFGDSKGPAVGYMLDACGNAHVQFKDRRSAWFKAFERYGHIRRTNNGVVEINHAFRARQEYGLRQVAARAALDSMAAAGVTGLKIWSYID
jgi:hypothetical protein